MNKFKRIIIFIIIVIAGVFLTGCKEKQKDLSVIFEEQRLAFNYFWETSNTTENSPGYGLVRDRYSGNPSLSSIAAVGFALAALPIGVKNEWITYQEGEERALKTLNTVLNLETTNGFYYHFINIITGKRSPNSEVSIIDTGLLVVGAIVAGEYFQGEILNLAERIYFAIDWSFYIDRSKNMFYMSYSPEKGFSGAWDHISEQLILYVLAAGSPSHPTDDSLYKKMKQIMNNSYLTTYQSTTDSKLSVNKAFYSTYNGSYFQYLFSHAFIDFRNLVDYEGTDWFKNSLLATKAHYAYVIDQSDKYKTYNKNSWGLSAGDGPNGYKAFGAMPAKNNIHNGTITPYAAISAIVFLEDKALDAANYFAQFPELWGQYGFKDSFNLGPYNSLYNPTIASLTPWFAQDYIGIDKGITLLMIENYRSSLVWDCFMSNVYVKDGLVKLGFKNN